MRILDYGEGSGYLEKILKNQGYQVDTYKPFGKNANTPTIDTKYQMIVFVEVLERVDKLIEAIENMMNYLGEMVLFCSQPLYDHLILKFSKQLGGT